MALISEETFTTLAKKKDTGRKKFNRFKTTSLSSVQKLIKSYNEAFAAREYGKATQCGIRMEGAIKSLPDDKREKYQEALDYVVGRIRGRTTKAALTTRQAVTEYSFVLHERTIKVCGEGMTDDEMQEILSNLKLIDALVSELVGTGFGPRRKWFGSSSVKVGNALLNFRSYLRTRCTRLTFVKASVGGRCDGSEVKRNLAGQVIPTVMLDGQTRETFRELGGEVNVSSGIRIFIGPLYFSVQENYDEYLKTVAAYRFMTLFHEMTHKILKTRDIAYDLPDTPQLVIDSPADCVANADSWGYFLADCALMTGRLPGVINVKRLVVNSAIVRRKMMGYDDDDD